jgi:hypothetical protein
MKNHVLTLTMLLAFVSSSVFAQQSPETKIHQIGISFSSLNQFGINYKSGNEKTLLRMSLLYMNLANYSDWGRPEDSLEMKQQSYGFGFRLGFEKHVPIVARLDFIWGLEAGGNFSYQTLKNDQVNYHADRTSWTVTPLVDVVLGVTYTFADHLVVGAEVTPFIQYSFGKSKTTSSTQTVETTSSALNFGFNSNNANLTLAYRFGK